MFEIRVDDGEVERELRVMPRQVPFALSVALNEVAWKARDALRATLPAHLTLRNAFTLSGITVEKGTKATLEAKVGELENRWWMASQALGEEGRRPPKGVVHVAQTGEDGSPRPAPDKVVPRSLRVDRIDKGRHGAFAYFVLHRDGKAIGIFYRSGAERPARRATMRGRPLQDLVRPRFPITKAYTFAAAVRIRPGWPMEQIVAAVVDKEWPEAVQKAVTKALWSAR